MADISLEVTINNEFDYALKINITTWLRMLSQMMAKEMFLIAFKMEVEENKEALEKTITLFDSTLKGLIEGDKQLKLTTIDNKDVKAQLEMVQSLWAKCKPIVKKTIASKNVLARIIKKVDELSLNILKEVNNLVQMLVVEAEKVTGKKGAEVVYLVGRQRTLSQKMFKELLLIAQGINTEENKEELKETADLFERTLEGLLNGDAELGLRAATNKHIIKQLKKIRSMWDEFKPFIYDAALKGKTPKDAVRKVMKLNVPLLIELDNFVQLYITEKP